MFGYIFEELKPSCSIDGFEAIFISCLKNAGFSLQTSENNLKPPLESLEKVDRGSAMNDH